MKLNTLNTRAIATALLTLAVVGSIRLHADDGAASIPVGGVVVLGREPRITMAKEALQISPAKVTVDYDFRNDTDDDITTAVAFPIPPYLSGEIAPAQQSFDDFRLWVDGSPIQCQTEARAFLKDKEFTELLKGLHVDIASFGHAIFPDQSPEIQKLSAAHRKQLQNVGLINSGGLANWQVRKKYYWQQTFPAHKTVHIRHEYSPVVGSENSIRYGLGPDPDKDAAKDLESFCIDDQLRSTLQRIDNSKEDAPYFNVDFILTTANTWKTPIEDFTLEVERPHGKGDLANYVSFCWDGPVTKTDADHFQAKALNLIPRKELRIGFFTVRRAAF
jgi:hypothetical protein